MQHVGDSRNAYKISVGKTSREERILEPAIKRRAILKWKTDCEDVNLTEVTQHEDHRVYTYNMKFYEQIT
jgi:hypothetical protein